MECRRDDSGPPPRLRRSSSMGTPSTRYGDLQPYLVAEVVSASSKRTRLPGETPRLPGLRHPRILDRRSDPAPAHGPDPPRRGRERHLGRARLQMPTRSQSASCRGSTVAVSDALGGRLTEASNRNTAQFLKKFPLVKQIFLGKGADIAYHQQEATPTVAWSGIVRAALAACRVEVLSLEIGVRESGQGGCRCGPGVQDDRLNRGDPRSQRERVRPRPFFGSRN